METLEVAVANIQGQYRYETLEGKKYIVAPVAMQVEGVANGSDGPLLYPSTDLAKACPAWNHKPIVVNHPEMNGKPISACKPEVLESRKIGMLLNTTYDGKQRSEAWIEESKANKVDKRIVKNVKDGKVMEVSTGLIVDKDKTPGEFNGKKYDAIARNHRPDHLAILPDRVGACSVADGAGLLANQGAGFLTGDDEILALIRNKAWTEDERHNLAREDFGEPEKQAFPISDQEDLEHAASLLHHADNPTVVKNRLKRIAKKKGLKLPASWERQDAEKETRNQLVEMIANGKLAEVELADMLTANVISHTDLHRNLSNAMTAYVKQAGGSYWPGWVEDVYANGFIYQHSDGKMYHAGYKMDEKNNKLSIDHPSDHKEVYKKTAYHDKKSGEKVAEKGVLVQSEVKEPSRPELGHGKHELPGGKGAVGTSDKAGTYNQQGATNMADEVAKKAVTTEEYVANAPPEIREMLNDSLIARKAEHDRLIGIITANKFNVFTKEELAVMNIGQLTKLATLAQPEEVKKRTPVYVGAGTMPNPVVNAGGDTLQPQEPLTLPTINWKKKE